jgi:hypothetical protein
MFFHSSSALFDEGVESCPDRNHLLSNFFGIVFSRKGGESGKIREQNGYLLALA